MSEDVIIKIDPLKYAFLKAKDKLLPERDAIQTDFTNTFFHAIRDKIDSRELIVIAVRGEVRTGKSTVVMKLVKYINKYIAKIKLNEEPIQNLTKYIFSDQTEFLRFINGEERNAAIAIDEFNAMASTGLNATTEEALFDHYSDVFAGQYLHRVTASPDVITDKNASIILDVIGKDEKKKTVRCKLIYRDVITKLQMTIGHVDIDVSDVIKGWLGSGVREIIETKGISNIEQQKLVKEMKEKDFYVRYQIKKYDRMNLLKKHGVRDIRDLEFSTLILEVLEELQEFAKVSKPSKELIDTIVDEVCKRNKKIYSMLTVNEIGQRSRAILNIYHEIQRLEKRMKKKDILPSEEMVLNKVITQSKDLLDKRIKEQEKNAKLYKDYMNIG